MGIRMTLTPPMFGLALAVLVLTPAFSLAQKCVATYVRGKGWVDGCSSSSGSSGGGGLYRAPDSDSSGPSAAELERRRRQEARDANDRGIEYYRAKDWGKALEAFKAALELWPDNKAIEGNFEKAQEALDDERGEAQRRAHEAELEAQRRAGEARAAAKMRESLQRWALNEGAAPPSSAGLDFIPTAGAGLAAPSLDPKVVDLRDARTTVSIAEAKGTARLAEAQRDAEEKQGLQFKTVDDMSRAREAQAMPLTFPADALDAQRAGETAERLYREALRLNADDGRAHNNLGVLLESQDRLKEAEAAFREAIRSSPQHVQGYKNLGATLARQGRYEEALAAYRKAAELDPASTTTRGRLVASLVDRADTIDRRQPDKARALYEEAIRLDGTNARAYNNLGVLLQSQGKLREAEAAYRQAVWLDPGQTQGYRNLGLVLQRQGRRTEAADAYRRADEIERVKAAPASAAIATGTLQPFPPGAPRVDVGPASSGGSTGQPPRSTGAALTGMARGSAANGAKLFDGGRGQSGEALPQLVLRARHSSGDPVIPAQLKTHPTITALERKRDTARQELATLEQQRQALPQQPDNATTKAQLAELDGQITRRAQTVGGLNDMIQEMINYEVVMLDK